ncbi:anti-repressor SinI family protein [Bacillus sp. FJAT-45066]|nr:anti-repressor SinI family protein [Bacillus sp. FJAT-45066]
MQSELDLEWVDLLLEAKQLGITDEEIREFLEGMTNKKEDLLLR